MPTLVVSDLHLASGPGVDVLRRADLREPFLAAVKDADRVVLLGDVLELRHAPIDGVLEVIEPFFRALGRALGRGREVWMTAGNHDWGLVAPWLEQRRAHGEPFTDAALGDPDQGGPLTSRIGEWIAASGARLRLAYPGMWLRDDVYAWHGHYGDLHTLIPTFERLIAGAMRRWVAPVRPAGRQPVPADYEAALAPTYAWMHHASQHTTVFSGAGASATVWSTIAHSRRLDPRRLAVAGAVRGVIAALNRTPIGPVSPDLSAEGLRRGGLHGARTAVEALGIDAAHVIFGHTHRSGPWPQDDASEWRTATGVSLTNTGSWTYGRMWLAGARPNENPYWPGVAAWLDESGPPRLVRLLGYRTHADFERRLPAEASAPEALDVVLD